VLFRSGTVKKISLAVLVDQGVSWEREKNGYRRVLVPPSAEKMKVIKDLVAGVTGLDLKRGDQITVETLPFESTLNLEPPALSPAPTGSSPVNGIPIPWPLDKKGWTVVGAAAVGVLLLLAAAVWLLRRSKSISRPRVQVTGPAALPGAEEESTAVAPAAGEGVATVDLESQMATQLAENEAKQKEMESRALNALRLNPAITKTAEILAKHLRETIKKTPEVPTHILRSWIREEDL
jgi:flagellar M-ring protein FliF